MTSNKTQSEGIIVSRSIIDIISNRFHTINPLEWRCGELRAGFQVFSLSRWTTNEKTAEGVLRQAKRHPELSQGSGSHLEWLLGNSTSRHKGNLQVSCLWLRHPLVHIRVPLGELCVTHLNDSTCSFENALAQPQVSGLKFISATARCLVCYLPPPLTVSRRTELCPHSTEYAGQSWTHF